MWYLLYHKNLAKYSQSYYIYIYIYIYIKIKERMNITGTKLFQIKIKK
ncbi:hypothetical protein ACMBCM_06930 [Spiroplasma sp. K1]